MTNEDLDLFDWINTEESEIIKMNDKSEKEDVKVYLPQGLELEYMNSLINSWEDGTLGIFLEGPPGTAKTTMVSYLAHLNKSKCITIDGDRSSDRRDFEGIHDIIDGNSIFSYGQIVQAIQAANIDGLAFLCINEINAIRESEQISFNGILSEGGINLISKAGESHMLRKGARLILIGTMNPGVMGVNKLQQAFKDRFPVKLVMDYPNAATEQIIVKTIAEVDDNISEILVATGRQLRKMCVQDGTLRVPFSTRQMVNFAKITSKMPLKFIGFNIKTMIVSKLCDNFKKVKAVETYLRGVDFENKITEAIRDFQNPKIKVIEEPIILEVEDLIIEPIIATSMKIAINGYLKDFGSSRMFNKDGNYQWNFLKTIWEQHRELSHEYFGKIALGSNIVADYKAETGKSVFYGGKITRTALLWMYRNSQDILKIEFEKILK